MDEKNKRKKKMIIIDIVIFLIMAALDQITKYFAVSSLSGGKDIVIIDGVFELHYLENHGAAFSMLQNQKIFFILIALVILAAIVFVLVRIPGDKKYNILHILLSVIAAGSVGNMIDRLHNDYVIDFLYFKLIDFPVFNVADIYITCSAILLAIVVIFKYKDEDIHFLSVRPNKTRDIEKSNEQHLKDSQNSSKSNE